MCFIKLYSYFSFYIFDITSNRKYCAEMVLRGGSKFAEIDKSSLRHFENYWHKNGLTQSHMNYLNANVCEYINLTC